MEYIIEGVKDFNTDHIFDCGQCFRWQRQDDGSYIGPAMGRVIKISYADGQLIIDNCGKEDFENIWKKYLDLDTDYGLIKEKLSAEDQIMQAASEYGYGIRILRQDFWETVVSFIISQNNNIPRIKGCIESICEKFGEHAGRVWWKSFFFYTVTVYTGIIEQRRSGSVQAWIQGALSGENGSAICGQGWT